MKLDKRINKNYKIYSCFDAEQAQEYVNTKGYFTDYYEHFNNVRQVHYGTLVDVDSNSEFSYRLHNSDREESYKFFLPEMFVKKEKKLRPYKNISEFCNNTGCKIIGSHCIHIRHKDTKKEELLLYTGVGYYNDLDTVHLGSYTKTLEGLFNNYEFLYKGNWMPFGVEDEL